MAGNVYASDTPDEVKNAKGIHLITFNTGNGQAVQILLEELAETYGFEWSTTILNIMVKEQKKDCKIARMYALHQDAAQN